MAEADAAAQAQLESRLAQLVTHWAERRTTLRDMLGVTEEELHAVANQGYLLFLQGKSEPARVIFEGLVAIDPKNAYYYRALGVIYWRLKEARKALKQFGYAVKAAPQEMTGYVNRAEIYIAMRQFDVARQDLHEALRNAGPNDDALVRKARAMLTMIQ